MKNLQTLKSKMLLEFLNKKFNFLYIFNFFQRNPIRKLPAMFLRIYSLIILALDLFTLLIGIWFAIILAVYRTFRPPPLKKLRGEVAMVSQQFFLNY